MKKFLVVMAALALVFAFVACGDDDNSSSSSSSAQSSASASAGSANSTASSAAPVPFPAFTTVNYTLDGGIKALAADIKARGAGSTIASGTELTSGFPAGGVVRGVVTASRLFFSGSYSNTIVIQDKEAGLWLRVANNMANSLNFGSFNPGDVVNVTIAAAKNNYGMLMVTKVSAISKVGAETALYYQEGDYSFTAMPVFNNLDKSAALFKKTGRLRAFDKYNTLVFTGNDMHSGNTDMAKQTNMYTTVAPVKAQVWTNAIGKQGKEVQATVYGPVILNYGSQRIFASTTDYIKDDSIVDP